MTWSKFGTEYRDECAEAGLSDAAFRTHTEALMYLYGIESGDMHVKRQLVRKWAGSDNYQAAVSELVAAGFWNTAGNDWQVVHHGDVFRQSLAAQQKKRVTEKKRMQDKRAAEARQGSGPGGASGTQSVGTNVGANVATNKGANVGPTQTDRQSVLQSSYYDAEVEAETVNLETGEIPRADPLPKPQDLTPEQADEQWLNYSPSVTRLPPASSRLTCPDCGGGMSSGRVRCNACFNKKTRPAS